MKTLLCLLCLAALSGCATTRLKVTTPDGMSVSVALPKNMDATKLKVKAGDYELSADRLITDASGVIREQNVGVSSVAGAVSDVAKAVTVP